MGFPNLYHYLRGRVEPLYQPHSLLLLKQGFLSTYTGNGRIIASGDTCRFSRCRWVNNSWLIISCSSAGVWSCSCSNAIVANDSSLDPILVLLTLQSLTGILGTFMFSTLHNFQNLQQSRSDKPSHIAYLSRWHVTVLRYARWIKKFKFLISLVPYSSILSFPLWPEMDKSWPPTVLRKCLSLVDLVNPSSVLKYDIHTGSTRQHHIIRSHNRNWPNILVAQLSI